MIGNGRVSSSVTTVTSAVALLLSSAILLSPRGAHAGECEQECVKGFSCQALSDYDCPPTACLPGQPCEPTPCEPTTVYECVAVPCTVDSDCAVGMACVKRDSDDDCLSTPSAAPCPPGTTCEPTPPSDPTPCEQKTEQTCVPRYQLPCKVASDCGTGFECEQMESCTSGDSGSAHGDPGGSGDVAPPVEPAPPQCDKTGVFHCTAELTTCNVSSDCPSGWTCVTVEERRGSSSDPGDNPPPLPGTDGNDPAGPGAAPQDPLPPESTTTRSYCAPPYYDLGIRGSLGGSIAGSDSNDSAPSPQEPGKSEGESTPSGDKTSGGCRTSAGHTGSSGVALLGTLGLLGLLHRRNRRPAPELG